MTRVWSTLRHKMIFTVIIWCNCQRRHRHRKTNIRNFIKIQIFYSILRLTFDKFTEFGVFCRLILDVSSEFNGRGCARESVFCNFSLSHLWKSTIIIRTPIETRVCVCTSCWYCHHRFYFCCCFCCCFFFSLKSCSTVSIMSLIITQCFRYIQPASFNVRARMRERMRYRVRVESMSLIGDHGYCVRPRSTTSAPSTNCEQFISLSQNHTYVLKLMSLFKTFAYDQSFQRSNELK